MRRLTLFLILLIVVFAFTVYGIAYYTRNVIKENIENEIAHINYELSQLNKVPRYEILLSTLTQSLFTSDLTLTLINLDSKQTYLIGPIEIDHGPFPVSALKRGQFVPKMAALSYQNIEQSLPYIKPINMDKKSNSKTPLIDLYLTVSYGQTYAINLQLNQLNTVDTPIILSINSAEIQGKFYNKEYLKMALEGSFNQFMINGNPFDSLKSSLAIDYSTQLNYLDEINLDWKQKDRYGEINYQGMLKTKHLNQFIDFLNAKMPSRQLFSLIGEINDIKSELSFDPDALGYLLAALLDATPPQLTVNINEFSQNLNNRIDKEPLLGMLLKRQNGKIISSIFVDHQRDKININGVEIPK